MWPFKKKVRPINFYTGHIISDDQGKLLEVKSVNARDEVLWTMSKPECKTKREFVEKYVLLNGILEVTDLLHDISTDLLWEKSNHFKFNKIAYDEDGVIIIVDHTMDEYTYPTQSSNPDKSVELMMTLNDTEWAVWSRLV